MRGLVYLESRAILVPRAYDPSGLWLGSRALAGPDILSMRRVFVSHCQPIRFAGFDGKSVIHGLPVLDQSSRSLPQARRIVGSGDENESRGEVDVNTFHKDIQYALERLGKSKFGFERTAVIKF